MPRLTIDYRDGEPTDGLLMVQDMQKELLEFLLGVCREIGVEGFLVAGSALGAVRHGDIIPWDDDIDIGMVRADYERLIAHLRERDLGSYFIQTDATEEQYRLSFAKLRKDGTCFHEEANAGLQIHQGVFIDIFPFDRIGEVGAINWLRGNALHVVDMFLLSNSPARVKAPKKLGARLSRSLFYFFSYRATARVAMKLRRALTRWVPRCDSVIYCSFGMYGARNFAKTVIRAEELDPIEYRHFGRLFAPVPKAVDAILTRTFGDYMKLPPVEHRRPLHSAFVETQEG